MVKSVREAIGDDIEVMADVCTAWNPVAVEHWDLRQKFAKNPASLSDLKQVQRLEEFKLSWIAWAWCSNRRWRLWRNI